METLTASCVRNLHVQVKSLNKQKPHTHTRTQNKPITTPKTKQERRRKTKEESNNLCLFKGLISYSFI